MKNVNPAVHANGSDSASDVLAPIRWKHWWVASAEATVHPNAAVALLRTVAAATAVPTVNANAWNAILQTSLLPQLLLLSLLPLLQLPLLSLLLLIFFFRRSIFKFQRSISNVQFCLE
jgi:hypothetical protein